MLTIGLTVANVPLDRMSHQPGSLLDYVAAICLEGAGAAVGALLAARRPRNPIGWLLLLPVDAAGNLTAKPAGGWSAIQHVTAIAVFSSLLVWLVVQVPRYRHAARDRRQQLKWLYGGAIVFVAGVVMPTSPIWLNDLGEVTATALPVCIGVAVLRYRLYEIDRIISRVISYAIITAVPAGVFAGLVVLATQVLPVQTPVAVAASTLVAAALFNPLRRRVQHRVDRRFNRARYDAEAVVDAFTTRLRRTVDLDTVRGDLVGAVHAAFEPAHVSVWLTAGPSPEHLPASPASAGAQLPAGRRRAERPCP